MKAKKDCLWIFFFIIIFVNGFEAGGYQASLWSIGKTYDLSTTSMGIFASVELFATMLAPILLGAWADRSNKIFCLKLLLCLQFASALSILLITYKTLFVGGMFCLGLTTSALQFITIAALTDNYPVSGKRKIGYMTSMYALGAFVAPLLVSWYLNLGLSWRTLYCFLVCGSTIAFLGMSGAKHYEQELKHAEAEDVNRQGRFVLWAILFLCVIMCIYVGFENGFAFFVDTLFTEELHVSTGKIALSIFWIVMIPSRVLVGKFEKYSPKILLAAILAIPLITIVISLLHNSLAVMLLCVPLGFACGAIYPSVLTILIPFAGEKTATATGMITTATGLGGWVFTALTGFVGDHWGLRRAMLFLAGCFLLSLLSVVSLRRKWER